MSTSPSPSRSAATTAEADETEPTALWVKLSLPLFSYLFLGGALYRLGRYPESLAHADTAALLLAESDETQSNLIAEALNTQALALSELGGPENLALAEARALEALAIWERQGERHVMIAEAYNTLGIIRSLMSRFTEALDAHHQALRIRRERIPLHHHTAVSLLNIGVVYRNMEDYASADSLHREALDLLARTIGEDDGFFYGYTLYSLARIQKEMGHTDQARPLAQRALTIQSAALGPESDDATRTRQFLADL